MKCVRLLHISQGMVHSAEYLASCPSSICCSKEKEELHHHCLGWFGSTGMGHHATPRVLEHLSLLLSVMHGIAAAAVFKVLKPQLYTVCFGDYLIRVTRVAILLNFPERHLRMFI